MTMPTHRHMPGLCALVAGLFVAALLAHEHFNGGVRSHHLLDRRDLPAISNWIGLIVLPGLGWLLGVRLRGPARSDAGAGSPVGVVMGLVCAALYGVALATSFTAGAATLTSGLFFGLLLLAVVLPIYRIEYIFGFVAGMTLTFGAVLPTLVVLAVATGSALVHFVFRAVRSWLRRRPEPPEAS